MPQHASRILLSINLKSRSQQLESPIYVGENLHISTTERYLTTPMFNEPIQALATFIGDFTPDVPSQHFLDYAIAASKCLPDNTAAANIVAYINRQITQPALSYTVATIR